MLHHMIRRLRLRHTFEDAIRTILDDAKALNGAEFGTLQLIADDDLLIVDERGFGPLFLKTFRKVARDEGSSCGRALRSGRTVLIEDVERDAEFAPYKSIARESGFRSVATTPLSTIDGLMIGVVSTHFARIHRPTRLEVEVFEQYCLGASDYLWDLLGSGSLDAIAHTMNDRLYRALEVGGCGAIGETPAPY